MTNHYNQEELDRIAKAKETNDKLEEFFNDKRNEWNKNVDPLFKVLTADLSNPSSFKSILEAQSTSLSFNSTFIPIGSTVNGLVMRCSLVNNNIATPSDIIDGIPINSTFGSNITYDPSFEKFVKIRDGIYSSMVITFTDQNLNTLYAQDPNMLLTLLIKQIKS